MNIIPGKGPIIENQEVVNEYNNISQANEQSESHQNNSVDERINNAQQCYKPFGSQKSVGEEESKGVFGVKINNNGDEKLVQYCHHQEERMSQIEIEDYKVHPEERNYMEEGLS